MTSTTLSLTLLIVSLVTSDNDKVTLHDEASIATEAASEDIKCPQTIQKIC